MQNVVVMIIFRGLDKIFAEIANDMQSKLEVIHKYVYLSVHSFCVINSALLVVYLSQFKCNLKLQLSCCATVCSYPVNA